MPVPFDSDRARRLADRKAALDQARGLARDAVTLLTLASHDDADALNAADSKLLEASTLLDTLLPDGD